VGHIIVTYRQKLYFAVKLNYIITNFKNKFKVMAHATTFNFHLHYTTIGTNVAMLTFAVITSSWYTTKSGVKPIPKRADVG